MIDSEIKLIYVGELVNEIVDHIEMMEQEIGYGIVDTVFVDHTASIKVSDLLKKLQRFKKTILKKG